MMKDTLTALLRPFGATGEERIIAGVIAGLVRGTVQDITTDALGNLIATRPGKPGGKRLMISAHMDHIGLVVTSADENGFLSVHNVGGISPRTAANRHVVFANGVHGVTALRPFKDQPAIADLYIDIGASTREEAFAKVAIGDTAVWVCDIVDMGDRVAAPAMDDRAGCAMLVELLYALKDADIAAEVVAVFSAQEEVGVRGARTAAYAIRPDVGLALDVTLTGDLPETKPKMEVSLGKGPAIKVKDSNIIATPAVRDGLVAAAKAAGVPYQMEVLLAGGTDAGAIQLTREGVPAGTLSIPCRYVHSPVEMVSVSDMENGVKLLKAFVEAL